LSEWLLHLYIPKDIRAKRTSGQNSFGLAIGKLRESDWQAQLSTSIVCIEKLIEGQEKSAGIEIPAL